MPILTQNTYSKLLKKKSLFGFGLILLLMAYYFCLPQTLFKDPTCMILNDREGNLLGAKIATDGQWRFPYQKQVPEKFVQAITCFEDQRFFYHPGFDPIGIARAIYQNIKEQEIVSGASTLSMQVIRLSRKGKSRNFTEKILEIILATRLEWRYSKQEIVALYASNAPFGGNVVGLETASWRYYGKRPALLSWAELAMLAVLPNSPALIHPGRNRQALLEKRNRLLTKLHQKEYFDDLTLELAKEEAIPDQPLPLPRLAPHLLDRAYKENFSTKASSLTRLESTIDRSLQESTNQVIEKHHQLLKGNDIHNAAALIIEIETGTIAAYVGNAIQAGAAHGAQVDVITAPRSTGSILKPFLYAGLLQDGQLLPNSLVSDIPTQMNGYQPKNFYESYDGVVSAKQALIRSLNIPFIKMLQLYGLEKFHFLLHQLGLSTITRPANYYGLPLILGGAEGSLWDITNAYVGMARTLKHFAQLNGAYDPLDFRPATFTHQNLPERQLLQEAPILDAAAIHFTFDAMQQVERPDGIGNWEQFTSSQKIAWKTGTSIGFRDAWAIGVTPEYAIGVWVGNADGEGRPGLVGVKTAAPILFDLFDLLPTSDWFMPPYDEMTQLAVCKKSGYRALDICEKENTWTTLSSPKAPACSYHQMIHLDPTRTFRVTSECLSPNKMQHQSWFVLPPGEAYYYKFRSPSFETLPPYQAGCHPPSDKSTSPMEMIYPKRLTKIVIPIDIDGQSSQTVFKVAHRNPETVIYWHLDEQYKGSTQTFHHQALNPAPGRHLLTLVDENGYQLIQEFEVLE